MQNQRTANYGKYRWAEWYCVLRPSRAKRFYNKAYGVNTKYPIHTKVLTMFRNLFIYKLVKERNLCYLGFPELLIISIFWTIITVKYYVPCRRLSHTAVSGLICVFPAMMQFGNRLFFCVDVFHKVTYPLLNCIRRCKSTQSLHSGH